MVGIGNSSQHRIITSIIAILLFFSLICIPYVAKADDKPQFGIKPASVGSTTTSKGYFVLKGQPGETLNDTVVVQNPGTVPVKLQVYPIDATTGQKSGLTYLAQNDPRMDVGSWVILEKESVDILPQQQVQIPFKLNIPKDALLGQHVGGIAVQLAAEPTISEDVKSQTGASFGVTTVTRALTAVQINVGEAEDKPSLKINGASFQKVDNQSTITLALQNNGTGLLKPKGEVTLSDSTGNPVMTSKLALDTFLPQDSIAYPVPGKLPAPGTYKVHASLDFGGSAPAVYDGQVEVKAQPVNANAPVTTPATQASANQPASANQGAANATGQTAATANANTGGQVAANANTAGADAGTGASMKLPFVGTANSNNAAPAAVTPGSENSSMLVGILIGIAAMLGLSTLGLGGYVLRNRAKKGQ
jgi:hypothetical protein